MMTPKQKSQPSSTNSSQSGDNHRSVNPANFYFQNPLTPQRNQNNFTDMGERSLSLGNLSTVLRSKVSFRTKLGKILMEHIVLNCSLKSKLFFISLYSFRIWLEIQDINERLRTKRNPQILPIQMLQDVVHLGS